MRCKNFVESTMGFDLSGQGRSGDSSGVHERPRSDEELLDGTVQTAKKHHFEHQIRSREVR